MTASLTDQTSRGTQAGRELEKQAGEKEGCERRRYDSTEERCCYVVWLQPKPRSVGGKFEIYYYNSLMHPRINKLIFLRTVLLRLRSRFCPQSLLAAKPHWTGFRVGWPALCDK